jgi:hypothetical protein
MKTLLAILILSSGIAAQTVTVAVDQAFVDAANTAFKEVVALRAANEALGKAVTANASAVDALRQVNELLKADNADLRKLKCDSGSILFVIRWKQCK